MPHQPEPSSSVVPAGADPAPPEAPGLVRLADYRPFTHRVLSVDLAFRLDPHATRVTAKIAFAPNPDRPGRHDLRLDGEGLRLLRAELDGHAVTLTPDATGITLPAALLPDGSFTLTTEVEIAPAANTALEGLYMSNGMYCTQCEAEGFRKITFYPDRPDVMAPFTVRIDADLPVLLSNGNPGTSGQGFAQWHDPWPKPAYLFALVAGDLVAHRDRFTTMSGRHVDLAIWVRPGDEDRCAYAMDSLIRSMRWDEQVYGREYDLDVFNIVAVNDFNMGAMENKGLNIFNANYVLASPETATDDDYAWIESVVAHEYFHNWTGNRITCRDWFQLCLKEGLTVFRDQQFTADMRSAPVKRIEDVMALRARQFREDAGPLAHPVRPDAYAEINNFYTSTVYKKGAEVIGMLKTLIGDAAWARGMDLYFARHDGQAATIEDWLTVFSNVTNRDLSQFARWYHEAGTPRVTVTDDWRDGTYTLTLAQSDDTASGQPARQPKVIPVAVGLIARDGTEAVATQMLELTDAVQSFRFEGLAARPVPSILRGFSAPVVLDHAMTPADRALLLAHDTDPFNRWEAGRTLAREGLVGMVTEARPVAEDWLAAMARLVGDDAQEPAYRALVLRLPAEDEIAQVLHRAGRVPDPDRIHAARRAMDLAMARRLEPLLPSMLAGPVSTGPFDASAGAAGRRALRLTALRLTTHIDGGTAAQATFDAATTMTEQQGALACLMDANAGAAALAAFGARWRADPNVIDKWFALQIAHARPERAVPETEALTRHPDFDWKNPNRFRSVMGALSGNPAGFHRADGSGYALLADWLIRLDPVNPQTAARMSTAFDAWRRYDAGRQGLMRMELSRILATPGLSRDLGEMAGRMLGA